MKLVILVAGALALSACEPAPADNTKTPTQEVTLKTPPVAPVKTLSTEITDVAYTGRVDVMGDASAYTLSSALTDKLRGLTTSPQLMSAIHDEFKAVWNENGLDAPQGFSTYAQIIGISEAHTVREGGQVLHAGLVSVEDETGTYGVTSDLEWDSEKEAYKIVIKPWGFTAKNITVLDRPNVREVPGVAEAMPMLGEMVGNEFHVTNTQTTDGAFHYTLIKVQNSANDEVLVFYGPDNFQTYR